MAQETLENLLNLCTHMPLFSQAQSQIYMQAFFGFKALASHTSFHD